MLEITPSVKSNRDHPLRPVVAMPSVKHHCAIKRRSRTGRSAMTDPAFSQWIALGASEARNSNSAKQLFQVQNFIGLVYSNWSTDTILKQGSSLIGKFP